MKTVLKATIILLALFGIGTLLFAAGGGGHGASDIVFPPTLESYNDSDMTSLGDILAHRISQNPFNLVASLIFLCAILHTFLSSKFLAIAHKWAHDHEHKKEQGLVHKDSVHFGSEIFHFLGEVEAVFGIWAVVLGIFIALTNGWGTLVYYVGSKVNYTEPLFVVVIMTLAATRPILKLTEAFMEKIANAIGGTLTAWWLTILTLGPILGSFITEPAAMTISALLLANKFYSLNPSVKFSYATIGLLFVNVSVGGTLSHFAAPPVLMVAGPWDWGLTFMLINFGWKATLGIIIANAVYYSVFKRELTELQYKFAETQEHKALQKDFFDPMDIDQGFEQMEKDVDKTVDFVKTLDHKCKDLKDQLWRRFTNKHGKDPDAATKKVFDDTFEEMALKEKQKRFPSVLKTRERLPHRDPDWDQRDASVPAWIIMVHVGFMIWTVINAHDPALFIGGFLFFLGFAQATAPFQNRTDLKPALLVGFFLAGLVIHGGLQGWWIAPVLGALTEVPLMLGATILTAFNDNAAITFLSTLVPGFTDGMKYAVVAGAVTGGGLTVIANAPNPAGQSILSRFFENGVSPLGLAKSALVPTIIMGLCFMLLRF